jgi:hypothetical protein
VRSPQLFIPQHRRELLILDTGPIREFVTFQAVHISRFRNLSSELNYLRDSNAIQKYERFVRSFKRRITSASVVAELNYWIRDNLGRRVLWQRIYDEFIERAIQEEVVPLLKMDVDVVDRLGPVDTSLMEIARQHSAEEPEILTTDNPLFRLCGDAQIAADHLRDVVTEEITL